MRCLVLSRLQHISFSVLLFGLSVGLFLSLWTGLVMAPMLVLISLVPIMLACRNKFWKSVEFSKDPIVIVIGASLIWVLASSLWSINIGASLMLFAKLSSLTFLAYFLLKYVRELSDKQMYLLCKCFSVIYITCIFLLLEEGVSEGALGKPIMSLLGSEFHMHVLNRGACILVVFYWLFVSSLERLIQKTKIRCALSSLVLLLLGYALSKQLSQSAMLGYLGGAVVFVVLSILRNYGKYLLQVGLVFGVLSNVFLFAKMDAETIAIRFDSLPDSAVHRLFVYDFVGEKATDKMLLGWGAGAARHVPGAADLVLSTKVKTLPGWTNIPLHTHNNVSQIWLELGVSGVLLLCAFLYSLVTRIYDQPLAKNCEKITLASMLCAYMLVGLVGFGVWQPWWIATGIIASALAVAMRPASVRLHKNQSG
jgi:O-antigen ligase